MERSLISTIIAAAVAVVIVSNASAKPIAVTGKVRCEAPGGVEIAAVLVSWNLVTSETAVVARAQPRSDGSFVLTAAEPEPEGSHSLAVVFESSGCRLVAKPLRIGQRSVGAVTLPAIEEPGRRRSFAVRGTVQLPDGAAAAGAAVRLMALQFGEFSISPVAVKRRPDGESATTVMTDRDGRFEFFLDSRPPNPYEEGFALHLLVQQEGYPPLMLPVFPTQTVPYAVRLKAESVRLTGVVVDEAGLPVEGAEVFAASLHTDMTTVVAGRTSPAGAFAFQLPDLQMGIRIAVNHAGSVPKELALVGGESRNSPLQIRLEKGVSVAGRLIRADDEGPVALGQIKALVSGGMFGMARTATADAKGEFELQGISPEPAGYQIAVEAEGFLPLETDWQSVVAPDDPFVLQAIALTRAVSWKLDVTDPAGTPVRDALVAVMQTMYGPTLETSRTDTVGQVTMRVAPGQYVLRVSSGAFPDHYAPFDVPKDRRDTVRLSENATIRGTLRWSDMTPAAQVKVRCLPARLDPEEPQSLQFLPDQREVETDANGVFVVERLAPGPYVLHLNASESVSRRIDRSIWPEHVLVQPGALVDLDGVLPKPATIELVLEGVLIPDAMEASLTELAENGEVANEFAPVRLEVVEGRALVEGFLPGRYNLDIRLADDAVVDPRIIEVTEGLTSVPVKTRRGQKVRGLVLSDQGVPLAGAVVSLWLDRASKLAFDPLPEDSTLEDLNTGEDGRFTTPALREARYIALATMDGFAPALVTFDVDADREPPPQTLTLSRGFPLQIDIVDGAGAPVPELIATLVREERLTGGRSFRGVQQDCERTATGCQFESVTPGSYVLRIVRGENAEEFPLTVSSRVHLRVAVAPN